MEQHDDPLDEIEVSLDLDDGRRKHARCLRSPAHQADELSSDFLQEVTQDREMIVEDLEQGVCFELEGHCVRQGGRFDVVRGSHRAGGEDSIEAVAPGVDAPEVLALDGHELDRPRDE